MNSTQILSGKCQSFRLRDAHCAQPLSANPGTSTATTREPSPMSSLSSFSTPEKNGCEEDSWNHSWESNELMNLQPRARTYSDTDLPSRGHMAGSASRSMLRQRSQSLLGNAQSPVAAKLNRCQSVTLRQSSKPRRSTRPAWPSSAPRLLDSERQYHTGFLQEVEDASVKESIEKFKLDRLARQTEAKRIDILHDHSFFDLKVLHNASQRHRRLQKLSFHWVKGYDTKESSLAPRSPTLKEVFRTFAADGERMFWRDFERLCKSSLLFDGQFTVPDAHGLFKDAIPRGQRSIGFEEFEQLISDVAFERKCTLDMVHQMVLKCL